jgi:hypothetical protein
MNCCWVWAVEAPGLQRQRFVNPVVEHSCPEAQHGSGLSAVAPVQPPGQPDARRKVEVARNVGLVFVPQPVAQRQVRAHFPVVLGKQSHIVLPHRGERVASRQRKLRGSAAKGANLRRRQAEPLAEQRPAVAFEAGDLHDRTGNGLVVGIEFRSDTAGKNVRPAEVVG